MKISLNFAKPASDSVSLKGGIRIPQGFSAAGKTARFDVDGVVKSFTLNAKGSAKAGTDSFKLKIKSTNGVVTTQTAAFSASFKKGSFASEFSDQGLIDDVLVDVPVRIKSTLSVGGYTVYGLNVLSYTARAGKSGKTK